MPQPLSKVHPRPTYTIGGPRLPHTPEMALAVVQVISAWAEIEYNYGHITARIARADPVTVTAVFQAMINADARKAALIEAAGAKLAPEEKSLIQAVLDTTRSSRDTRNEFAHHLWGILFDRPDCALLAKPGPQAMSYANVVSQVGKGPLPKPDHSGIMVWMEADFKAAVEAAQTALDRVRALALTFDHPGADQGRRELLKDPQIERRYDHFLRENAP